MSAEEQRREHKKADQGMRLTFKLTPQEANLMHLLLALPIVTPEVIAQRLGIATEIRVAIYRLRRALKEKGIDIQSKRLFGYWLDDDAKARVKELIRDRMGETPPVG